MASFFIPGFATVDFYSFEKRSSLLRALSPEVRIVKRKWNSYSCMLGVKDVTNKAITVTSVDNFMCAFIRTTFTGPNDFLGLS